LPRSPAKGRILADGAAATRQIDAILTSELEAAGIGSDQLLLVGFSQGRMVSLQVGLCRLEAVAGISGMLVAPVRLQAEI
jgi:phospholipase/carboxylesterase